MSMQRIPIDEEDDLERVHSDTMSLSTPLRLLYALNGLSLSLPSTALMYIVNTRAAIPIALLSVYGSIAFLPCSLKPLYAHFTPTLHRPQCLVGLLALGGITTAMTVLVPPNGIFICITLAFARGMTGAWAEFLLDMALIEQSSSSTFTSSNLHFSTTAALFQSQAATYRGAGSIAANIVALLLFSQHGTTITLTVVTILLLSTGILLEIGAVLAWFYQVGATTTPHTPTTSRTTTTHTSTDNHTNHATVDATFIITVQLLILLFAFQGPLQQSKASTWGWHIVVLIGIIILILQIMTTTWNRSRRVAAFLIIRHAMPGATYVMSSFVYGIFQSSPFVYQLLGFIANIMTTLSSWSYGKLMAQFSEGSHLLKLIAGTTVIAALLSLLDLIVVQQQHEPSQWHAFAVITLVHLVTNVAGQWQFLPSVVLATTSITFPNDDNSECELVPNDDENVTNIHMDIDMDMNEKNTKHDNSNSSHSSSSIISYQQSTQQQQRSCCPDHTTTAMQYGTLISCIDFGDQIGSWLTVPLVTMLGITRENDWENIHLLIFITAALSLLPLVFIPILREP